MSNPNTPFGFRWLGPSPTVGAPATGSLVKRKILSSNNTPICFGDAVQSLSSGYIGIDAAGITGSITAGIFAGCAYNSTALGELKRGSFWPNGDHAYDGEAYIIPLAGQMFAVQSDGFGGNPVTLANVGDNIDIVVGTQTFYGSFGQSGMTVGYNTINTTNTLPFKIIGLYSDLFAQLNTTAATIAGTDNTSPYNIVLVEGNAYNVVGV